MTGPSPAERVLRLAAYLAAHRSERFTLDDIASNVPGYLPEGADPGTPIVSGSRQWETVRKKVQRDLGELHNQWGIELVYDEVEHEYRLAPPFFTPEERAALISAAAVVSVEGLGLPTPGAIGSGVDDGLARVVIHVHRLVARVRDAIASRTPLRFRYEGRTRVLEPWALGAWRAKWYVAGGDPGLGGAMRRFRLDRIETEVDGAPEPAGTPGSYDIPDWFDPDKAFDFDPNSWGHDPPLRARVRVEHDHVPGFRRELGGEIVTTDHFGARIELTVRHYESFRNRLLAFRGHAVVESPPQLVALVRDHLRCIAGRSEEEVVRVEKGVKEKE